jgi:hypothetical protein
MTDLTEHDIYLFREGTHYRAYDLGAPGTTPESRAQLRYGRLPGFR